MKTVKELREVKYKIMTKKLNQFHVKDIHRSFDALNAAAETVAKWTGTDYTFSKSLENDIPGAMKDLTNVHKQMINGIKIIKKYEKQWTKIGKKGVEYKVQE